MKSTATGSFPFELVKKSGLVPVENYYMQLLVPRGQVSRLKGTFSKYHTENDTSQRTYAVFKNVVIMNKKYKKGTCRRMLIRHPGEGLANTDCDTYSDHFQKRTINADREVYLDVKFWKFGMPTEKTLLSKQILRKIPTDMEFEIDTFTGEKTPFNKQSKSKSKSKGGKKRNPRKNHTRKFNNRDK